MAELTKTLKQTLKMFAFKGIRFKMSLAVLIASLVLLAAAEITMDRTMYSTVETLMSSRMQGDIKYIEDLLDNGTGSEWHIKDGALYRGDVLIGDGTEENAYLEPFLDMEQKTGSFSYTFVKCPDEGLIWVGDQKSGYQQGHYMRVAGSTLSPNGQKIIGTYMDKAVADVLDAEGTYSGQANVVGGMVYCLYNTVENNEGETVGVIVVGRSIEAMHAQARQAERTLFWIIIAAMFLVGTGLDLFVFRWIAKLDKVNNYLKDISSGTFPEEELDLNTRDELSLTAQSINEMTVSLKEKARISSELEIANQIQAHMLPCIFPPFPEHDEFDIYAAMYPAKEVGGDFYDFFMVDDHRLAMVIADVSGKGVPAALFMVIAKTLIKNYAQTGMDPANVFTKVNQLLCDGNDTNLFVTAWMGILDLETGVLTYVNAGHNPPMIKSGNDEFTYLKSRTGFVLAGLDISRYTQKEITMHPGDKLLLYTDGVTEATNLSQDFFGEQRLKDYMNAHDGSPVMDTLLGLKRDIDIFSGDAEQFDDITMLMMNYNKASNCGNITEKLFKATLEELPNAMAFIESELEKADCPAKDAMQLSVAAEEIFVNIARYAYPGEIGSMRLGAGLDGQDFILRFTDFGIPFDPLKKQDPDVTLDAESREIGGLGIFMVKKTMDDVQYIRKDNQNILTLIKHSASKEASNEI